VLVLQSPRRVFAALRDDSDEVAAARQDTAGAIAWLAGIAAVLATSVASTLLDDVQIDAFLVYLTVEKGLAANTIEAYGRDLASFHHYLVAQEVKDASVAGARHLIGFLTLRRDQGLSARSQARGNPSARKIRVQVAAHPGRYRGHHLVLLDPDQPQMGLLRCWFCGDMERYLAADLGSVRSAATSPRLKALPG